MTQTVGEITEQLSAQFVLGKAAGWDPVGLQIGDPSAVVNRVAVCHEITESTLQRLIGEAVDLVVVYHPLLFRPVTSLLSGSGPAGRAHRLIANGISLIVAHTAFDVAAGGAADALAAAFDLRDVSAFGPLWGTESAKVVTFIPAQHADAVAAAMAAAGAGRIGHYSNCTFRASGVGTFLPAEQANPFAGEVGDLNFEDEVRLEMFSPLGRIDAVVAAMVAAHPYEEPAFDVIEARSNAGFIGRQGFLSKRMNVGTLADIVVQRLGGVVRVAGSGEVSTVAVVPGSGGRYLLDHQADVVITGDVSHHQAAAAVAAGKAVVDPGHIATERPGLKALYAAVAESIDDVIDMTDEDPDPWKEP